MRSLLAPFLTLLAAGKICSDTPQYALEVVLVQDTTDSFSDDFKQLREEELEKLREVFSRYTGSRFGVTTFRDKPLKPYGWPETDYCVKYDQPLSTFDALHETYSRLGAAGGGDQKENSLGGILSAAMSSQMGWSPAHSAPDGDDYVRLIFVITDAPPHEAAEANQFNLPAHNGKADSLNATQCASYWYPSADQVASALKNTKTYLVGLIQGDSKVFAAWQWFNDKKLNQPTNFVQKLNADSSNLAEIVRQTMPSVDNQVCPEVSTTPKPAESVATCPALPPPMPDICRVYLANLIKFFQQ